MNGAPKLLSCGLARVMVVVFVCLTAAVSLAWSHHKLMSQDEMYEFQTDSVLVAGAAGAGAADVADLAGPAAVPLAVARGRCRCLGVGAFALRLPALLGFLLMQVCLFFFVRNLAGDRAGCCGGGVSGAHGHVVLRGRGAPVWVDAGVCTRWRFGAGRWREDSCRLSVVGCQEKVQDGGWRW